MRFATALLVAVLSLTTLQAKADGPSLVGSWYGEGQPNDPGAVWLAQLSQDGTFKAFFRTCAGQRAVVGVMDGRWKVTGTLMEIFVQGWNGEPRNYRDGYQILANNGKTLRYKFTEPGNPPSSSIGHIFTSSRVPDSFKIPGCDIVS
jgi:hypothetical protein